MKPSAFLINTARGKIVNEKDLENALLNQEIAGAACDVFENEPKISEGLLACPHFFGTPHIGGNSKEAVLNMGRSAIQHIHKFVVASYEYR